jgi:hypothetical protein
MGSGLRSGLVFARRSIATGLLCLFLTLCAAPTLFFDSESNLPACCRRDGKHQCSMIDISRQTTGGARLSAVTLKCPLFPKVVPPAHGFQLYPFATQSFFQGVLRQPAFPRQAEIRYRVSSTRAHQKRGPPRSTSVILMRTPQRGTA